MSSRPLPSGLTGRLTPRSEGSLLNSQIRKRGRLQNAFEFQGRLASVEIVFGNL